MAEGARLESVCTATYREFESLTHRHILKGLIYQAFFRLPSEAGKPVGLKEARIALTGGKIIRIARALLANGRV